MEYIGIALVLLIIWVFGFACGYRRGRYDGEGHGYMVGRRGLDEE